MGQGPSPPPASELDFERVQTHAPAAAIVALSVLVAGVTAARHAWAGAAAYAALVATAACARVPKGGATDASVGARAMALWAWRSAAFAPFAPDGRLLAASTALCLLAALSAARPATASRWHAPLLFAAATLPTSGGAPWVEALRVPAFAVAYACSEYRRTARGLPALATPTASVAAAGWTLLAHPWALAAAPLQALGVAALVVWEGRERGRGGGDSEAPPPAQQQQHHHHPHPPAVASAPAANHPSAPAPSSSSSSSTAVLPTQGVRVPVIRRMVA